MKRVARMAMVLLLVAAEPALAAAPVEFVHVGSNTGGASGGHAALRVGDFALHFQMHPDGLLHLQRTPWSGFVYHYGSLENRDLTLVPLPLADGDVEQLERRAARRLVIEGAHHDRLAVLGLEKAWFEALAAGRPTLALPGAGLFAAHERGDRHALSLRDRVVGALGPGVLEDRLARVERALAADALKRAASADVAPSLARLPTARRDAATRRRDELRLRAAFDALHQARPLARAAWLEADPTGPALAAGERRALEAMSQRLGEAVIRLLDSPRPDRGAALLVAIARFQITQRSLVAGRLLLLEVLPDSFPAHPVSDDRRPMLRSLAARFEAFAREVRRETLSRAAPDERALARLEGAAARSATLRRALRDGVLQAAPPGPMLPLRAGPVPLPTRVATQSVLENAAIAARERERRYRDQLDAILGYDLLSRNCATELRPLLDPSPRDEEGLLDFVPLLLRASVEHDLARGGTRVLPSYRRRMLASMQALENDWIVALRESNTWTSRIHRAARRDEAFLLFAQEAGPARPLFGAVNLVYGLARAGLGALSWPADAGRGITAGLRGALYSLPELGFVSLRKGRFEYVAEDLPLLTDGVAMGEIE